MKGSLLGKFLYLFCAVAGVVLGCGIVAWNGVKQNIDSTKDNTLIRENGDSVFFVQENEKEKPSEISALPKQDAIDQVSVTSELSSITQKPQTETQDYSDVIIASGEMSIAVPGTIVTSTPIAESVATPEIISTLQVGSAKTSASISDSTGTPVQKTTVILETTEKNTDISEDKLPSLGQQWVSIGTNVQQPTLPSVTPQQQEIPTAEVITYPVQIFGQVPVINRSDTYVSYFEFAYDLVAMLEPIVEARGLNMNSLLTQFVIKALFCGVDIEKLDINAPIPRRLAALCLWLAAQVLNESGYETSAQSAEGYVKDIAGCSVSEKKAIAYLYESGILKGYKAAGQCFYPREGLKTEDGTDWISAVKQRWK